MSNEQNSDFRYTYSAKEQAELKKIREKYETPVKEESKIERLHRLDRSVTHGAQTVALILGIVGALIMGFGMSLIMTADLADVLGAYRDMALPLGIVVGLVGGGMAALAYPVYQLVLKRRRQKLAPEILRLTDELMK